MSDAPQPLREIDWRRAFPFTQIFRSFRIAIQPAKLGLAVVAILLLYSAGRLLDLVWPDVPGGVARVEVLERQLMSGTSPAQRRVDLAALDQQINARYETVRRQMWALAHKDQPDVDDKFGIDDIKATLRSHRDEQAAVLRAAATRPDEQKMLGESLRGLYQQTQEDYDVVEDRAGRGVFDTFLRFEAMQVRQIALGVLRFDWLSHEGVFWGVFHLLVTGPIWVMTEQPWYALIIGIVAAVIWAVFGGAISRICAVEVARDYKISIRSAVQFSLDKLVSFVSAPLMPLAAIGLIGVAMAVVGWLTELPFVGPTATVVVGLGFVVVLVVAVILALTLLGTIAGFGLMYPTISVENTDSFDAVSRSYSYVFGRPWKLTFFYLVALVHAAVTYAFLRFVVALTFGIAAAFLLMTSGTLGPAGEGTSIAHTFRFEAAKWWDLVTPPAFFSLSASEAIASFFLLGWSYLFATLLGAYLLSVFVASSTVIYYLMRADVDATAMYEVYVEPEEVDDAIDDPDPTEPPATSPATSPVATPTADAPPAAPAQLPAAPPVGEADRRAQS